MSRPTEKIREVKTPGYRLLGFLVFHPIWIAPMICLVLSAGWDNGFSLSVIDRYALLRLWNSIAVSVLTVVFSLVLAFPLVAGFYLVRPAYRPLWIAAGLIPLSYPPFATASAWMMILAWWEQGVTTRVVWGSSGWITAWLYSIPGAAWMLSLCYWPIVFFLCILTARLQQDQIDSARLYLTSEQTWKHVYFPAWKYPAAFGSLIVFLLSLKQFEVPSFLQVDVYPLEIYTRFASYLSTADAVVLCLPYIVLLSVLAWGIGWFYRTQETGSSEDVSIPVSSRIRTLVFMVCGIVCVFSFLFPLIALFQQSGSLSQVLGVIADHMGLAFGSVVQCVVGGTIIALIGWIFFLFPQPNSQRDHFLYLLLFTIPSIVIAAGWLEVRSWIPGRLTDTLSYGTVLLAGINHYMILGLISGELMWQHFGKAQCDSVSLLDLPFWKRLRLLYLPSFAFPMLKASGLIALFLWSEIAIYVLLQPPGGDTLTVKYYNLLHYGSESRTAAIGFLLMAVPASLVVILYTLNRMGKAYIERNRRTA